MTPHSRLSTVIGAPTTEPNPRSRAKSAGWPEASATWSMRAGRPVSNTSDTTFRPPRRTRVPTGKGMALPVLAHPPMAAAMPSGSYRLMPVTSAASTRPASAATAAKTSSGGAARATSVATRRSAACSSANSRSSTRAWALAIAAAASSVNPASRTSVSAGSGCSRVDARLIAPHSRPSTLIGAATAVRMPNSRATSAAAPETPA